jgi:hypothetical protein
VRSPIPCDCDICFNAISAAITPCNPASMRPLLPNDPCNRVKEIVLEVAHFLISSHLIVTVVRWTSFQKDVRLPLSAGGGGDATPPSPVWIWGGENLLYLSPPVKGTVQ